MNSLINRVARLEKLICESKYDQDILREYLGQEYYNKYILIKNKISDPEFKDIYKLINKDPKEVQDFIDSFKSKSSLRKLKKDNGAKLIYNKDDWKVYHITTYDAAVLYGSNTKWCISGRYEGRESEGKDFFNLYIKRYDLDGGYYFYIHKNDKWCILKRNNGNVVQIYDKLDHQITLYDLPFNFPNIPGVLKIRDNNVIILYSNNSNDIKEAVDLNLNFNVACGRYSDSPLIWQIKHNNYINVELMLKNGADPNYDNNLPLLTAIQLGDSKIVKLLINNGASINVLGADSENKTYSMLMIAVDKEKNSGDYSISELLLKNNADTELKSNSPYTALCISVLSNDFELSNLLLEYGANPNPINGKLINFTKSARMKNLLKSYGAK